jgi:transcription elongation GreA/GreB family factor
MSFKQEVYTHCLNSLDDKIKALRTILTELEEGSENDSKSSAGDKHETARAMMQLEQEKIGKQLQETLAQKAELERVGVTAPASEIKKGSLVKTNKGYLLLAIAAGKINAAGTTVMAISSQSPLAQKLLGLKTNNTANINGASYFIESIE